MADLLAYQTSVLQNLQNFVQNGKYSKMRDIISSGALHLYLSREQISHEKIYLLQNSQNEKRRVIFVVLKPLAFL